MSNYSILLSDGTVAHFDDDRTLEALFSQLQSKNGLRIAEAELWMEGSTAGRKVDAIFNERHTVAVYRRIIG